MGGGTNNRQRNKTNTRKHAYKNKGTGGQRAMLYTLPYKVVHRSMKTALFSKTISSP